MIFPRIFYIKHYFVQFNVLFLVTEHTRENGALFVQYIFHYMEVIFMTIAFFKSVDVDQ